jgi:hypothetical protein
VVPKALLHRFEHGVKEANELRSGCGDGILLQTLRKVNIAKQHNILSLLDKVVGRYLAIWLMQTELDETQGINVSDIYPGTSRSS